MPPSGPEPLRATLLSNGRLTVALTRRAGGFSTWQGLAVTRWRDDPTCDDRGSHVLLRDIDGDAVWSMGPGPLGMAAAGEGELDADFARFVRRDVPLHTTLEVVVARDHDAELRLVTLENHGADARTVELTSYAELVLGPGAQDGAHPAFSKMFVTTRLTEDGTLLAERRPRAPDEPRIAAVHWAEVDPPAAERPDEVAGTHESDRARFLGRGRLLREAAAMQRGARLEGATGCVLDPVFCVRRRIRVEPGSVLRVAFWTALADSPAGAIAIRAELARLGGSSAVIAAAGRQAADLDRAAGVDPAAARRMAHLLAPLIHDDPAFRADAALLAAGRGGAPTLWPAGISGDRPIVLLRIAAEGDTESLGDLLVAQRAWQCRGFGVDVVVLLDAADGAAVHPPGLEATIDAQQKALAAAKATKAEAFLLDGRKVAAELRAGLFTAARVLLGSRPAPAAVAPAKAPPPPEADTQVARRGAGDAARQEPGRNGAATSDPASRALDAAPPRLAFCNGHGGFAIAEREYRITLDESTCTPLPWVNVIANARFGFLVSAEGGGYAWSLNSQQNPLTPWPNDPVTDAPHEAIYLRDEDSGQVWSACAAPIRVRSATYTIDHGKGYSRFAAEAHGIEVELLQFVPREDPVKLSWLRVRNRGRHARRLSVTAYVQWALAPIGQDAAPSIVTSRDAASGALFARNCWREEFDGQIAFLDFGGRQAAATGDRCEFIGRGGDVGHPEALLRGAALSGRTGAGLDPCGVLQAPLRLEPGAGAELLCLIGDASSEQEARALVLKYRDADPRRVLHEVVEDWGGLLDAVQVRTPDPALDVLVNDWLPYQVLSCRVWARTAYYQASGAWGFRDQLQDVMALCLSRPAIAREHILRAAGRQFREGDVQHWWLPPGGRGIRTRISDDRLWLVWAAMHYLDVTADAAILDEPVPFLDGPRLADGQLDAFFAPKVSDESGSLYEHCARAVDASLGLGPHGLPLFGTGDWNDGMNRVGAGGRGESIWLAWFLLACIDRLVPCARQRGDDGRLGRWQACETRIRQALDASGWDGAWFRRGYYDDGTPLGSATSEECRIDQIAQSWSVLAGTAEERARPAMEAVWCELVRSRSRIAPLIWPPFDSGPLDPGYIKGYPPGLRENGGQYTHGATWSIFAFTRLGQGERAGELLSFLNPVHHGGGPAEIERYKVEPYVACGDVYSVAPLEGRGGWSWYTGSAGWLYRAAVEAVLGFRVHGESLEIDPCMPSAWPGFEIRWQRQAAGGTTPYRITVENPGHVECGIARAEHDGAAIARQAGLRGIRVALRGDGHAHRIDVVMG
ncbi:MAG: glycosyl transferase family 36 [Xanthomonadales bacterium]|nr:glycosyl transferase family 36 [Xanthomonadales bacterium]